MNQKVQNYFEKIRYFSRPVRYLSRLFLNHGVKEVLFCSMGYGKRGRCILFMQGLTVQVLAYLSIDVMNPKPLIPCFQVPVNITCPPGPYSY